MYGFKCLRLHAPTGQFINLKVHNLYAKKEKCMQRQKPTDDAQDEFGLRVESDLLDNPNQTPSAASTSEKKVKYKKKTKGAEASGDTSYTRVDDFTPHADDAHEDFETGTSKKITIGANDQADIVSLFDRSIRDGEVFFSTKKRAYLATALILGAIGGYDYKSSASDVLDEMGVSPAMYWLGLIGTMAPNTSLIIYFTNDFLAKVDRLVRPIARDLDIQHDGISKPVLTLGAVGGVVSGAAYAYLGRKSDLPDSWGPYVMIPIGLAIFGIQQFYSCLDAIKRFNPHTTESQLMSRQMHAETDRVRYNLENHLKHYDRLSSDNQGVIDNLMTAFAEYRNRSGSNNEKLSEVLATLYTHPLFTREPYQPNLKRLVQFAQLVSIPLAIYSSIGYLNSIVDSITEESKSAKVGWGLGAPIFATTAYLIALISAQVVGNLTNKTIRASVHELAPARNPANTRLQALRQTPGFLVDEFYSHSMKHYRVPATFALFISLGIGAFSFYTSLDLLDKAKAHEPFKTMLTATDNLETFFDYNTMIMTDLFNNFALPFLLSSLLYFCVVYFNRNEPNHDARQEALLLNGLKTLGHEIENIGRSAPGLVREWNDHDVVADSGRAKIEQESLFEQDTTHELEAFLQRLFVASPKPEQRTDRRYVELDGTKLATKTARAAVTMLQTGVTRYDHTEYTQSGPSVISDAATAAGKALTKCCCTIWTRATGRTVDADNVHESLVGSQHRQGFKSGK